MTDQKSTLHFKGQDFTYDGLFNLSGPELVALHNKFADEPTKRFSDKVAGAKRTWAVLAKKATGVAATPTQLVPVEPKVNMEVELTVSKEAVVEEPKAPKAPKEPKAAKPRATRGMRFVFPQADVLKKVRENTERAALRDLCTRREGATFEECLAATWGKRPDMTHETKVKTCYEALRLLHYYVGYGMKQTETGERKGAIHLFFHETTK